MSKENSITKVSLFNNKQIRRIWDESQEKWFFSVVDVVAALSESKNPAVYWRVLKKRLLEEGGDQTVTKCNGFKLPAADGKIRLTDMADTETMFRIIQSIPSPNAEPFKLWLAQVGYERVEETADPELTIQRAMQAYLKKGYSKDWVNMRLKSIEIRRVLTDEWVKRGIRSSDEFAQLTDEIALAWAGMTTREYKKFKEITKENLRDNMTNLELILNMLAEASTTEISQVKEPKTFHENKMVAKEGGSIAGKARRSIEYKTGKKVITKESYIKQISHQLK